MTPDELPLTYPAGPGYQNTDTGLRARNDSRKKAIVWGAR